MCFYFSIFSILLLWGFFEIYGIRKRQLLLFYIFFSVILFAFSFLRWETGTDWDNYFAFFNSRRSYFEESEFEPGFSLINEIGKITFNNYTVVLFLGGLILFYFQNKSLYILSPFPIISLLYIWSIQFAGILFIRQMISTAILLYSVIYIIKGERWHFLFCVLLAFTFHRSAIIFIFAWFCRYFNFSIKRIIIFAVVALCLAEFFKMVFMHFSGLLGSVIGNKLAIYSLDPTDMHGGDITAEHARIRGLSNKFLVLAFGILSYFRQKTHENRILLNIYLTGILLYLLLTPISIIFARFTFPFDIIQIVIIPIFISTLKKTQNKIFFYIIFSCYLFLRLKTALSSFPDLLIPYKTVLEL